MEGVNILARIDSHNNFVLVKMLGKRKLTENSVDFIVFVELVNESVKLFLCCAFGKLVGLGVEAYLVASALFVSYVHLRCGIFTNYYYRKSRANTRFFNEALRFCFDFVSDVLGYFFSVN